MDELSVHLPTDFCDRMKHNITLQDMIKTRNLVPVSVMKQSIIKHINDNYITIITGETGCGKSSQICQYILDDYIGSGRGAQCNILVTQPRRLAAVSSANRVAQERLENIGDSVGYDVTTESQLPRPYTSILFCTVAELFQKLEKGLRGVSHVILDEIYER